MKSNLFVIMVVIISTILIVIMLVNNQFITYKDTENFIIKIQKNGTTTLRYYENKMKKRLSKEEMEELVNLIYENNFFEINDVLNTEWDGETISSFLGTTTSITIKYDGKKHTAQGGRDGSSIEYQRIENYIISLWSEELAKLIEEEGNTDSEGIVTNLLNTMID